MSRAFSRALSAVAGLLLAWGVFTAGVFAMREPFSLNDYAAIWGLKAHALQRSGSLSSLFRVDPQGAFSHPEYPPLWPLLLMVAERARLPFDDLVATPLWPLLALAASLLAVRAARSWNVAWPFALLAGAAVSLLPYWRRYPGYAEGLLLVLVLAAAGEAARAGEGAAATARLSIFLTLAVWTKPEGLVAALAASAILAGARRLRAALLVAVSALLFAALPWALVVRSLAPSPPPTDFALSSFSPAKLGTALWALAAEGAPAGVFVLGATLLLALAPETLRRRRAVLGWTALVSGALIFSFAFSRLDPLWHVRWSWDRILVVPAAVLILVLAEALAECVTGRSGDAPLPASLREIPPPEIPAKPGPAH